MPKCGQPVMVGEAFCGSCGARLGNVPPVVVKAPQLPPVERASSQQPAPKEATPSTTSNSPRLLIQSNDVSLPFPSGKAEVIVGRDDPGSNNYPEVNLGPYMTDKGGISRRHARFFLRDGHWNIEDLNSTNFTFLNKQRLQPNQSCPVENGDEVRLGLLTMTFLTG